MTTAKVISVYEPAVRCRIALIQWAFESDILPTKDIKTNKATINRRNRYTHKKEKYTTERPINYKTNQRIRLLDIWCRLRAFEPTHVIRQRKSKMQAMSRYCECSIGKLRPALNELHRMGWIHMDDHCIAITSEQRVYSLCGLDYYRKLDRVFYKPEKIDNEKTTYHWLYLAEIEDNRQRQGYMFHQAITQTPENKLWMYGVIQSNGYEIMETEHDHMLVASMMNDVYMRSLHGREVEMHDFLVEHRPDVNRSVLGMAYAWNTHPMNVCYIKKKLLSQRLAEIKKIGTISSPGRSRNPFIHIATVNGVEKARGTLWNKKSQTTFQSFCDDIRPRMADYQGIIELRKTA